MQHIISKEQLLEKFDRLNPFMQQTVAAFIDALLKRQVAVKQRDKSSLLKVSVWNDEEIQQIEETQTRINAWQLPVF